MYNVASMYICVFFLLEQSALSLSIYTYIMLIIEIYISIHVETRWFKLL